MESVADALILDLEDSVPEDKKMQTRTTLRKKVFLCKKQSPLFVRVNAKDTGLLEKDIEAMALPEIDGFILPKVRNAKDIIYLEHLLLKIENKNKFNTGKFLILPLIENSEAVLNVFDIAKSSKRIHALIFGHEDFLLDIHATHTSDLNNLIVPKAMISMAARAIGCQPIDTPYLNIKDVDGCI